LHLVGDLFELYDDARNYKLKFVILCLCLVCRLEFYPATGFFSATSQRVLVIPYIDISGRPIDISGRPIDSIFKLQEEGLLALEEETDKLSIYEGIRNYHYSLLNSPEGRSSLRFLRYNTFILFLLLSFVIVFNIPGKKEIFFFCTDIPM
jgi:hypothetical protein